MTDLAEAITSARSGDLGPLTAIPSEVRAGRAVSCVDSRAITDEILAGAPFPAEPYLWGILAAGASCGRLVVDPDFRDRLLGLIRPDYPFRGYALMMLEATGVMSWRDIRRLTKGTSDTELLATLAEMKLAHDPEEAITDMVGLLRRPLERQTYDSILNHLAALAEENPAHGRLIAELTERQRRAGADPLAEVE